jgi:hypothetical protein
VLVAAHEARVTSDIRRQNSRQSPYNLSPVIEPSLRPLTATMSAL